MADLEARPIDDLLDRVAGARFVLLGEATHGTHEFYAVRAELTRRLIAQRGFRGVAVEADWPAAARANRYIHDSGDAATPRRRWATSSASRSGCGATAWSST